MKIAILGTENSHAHAFAQLIRDKREKYADIEFIGVYGYDAQANQRLLDEGLVSYVAHTADEFVDQADAVIITARHGDLHYEYAMPYIKKGIPAFVDKPFAIRAENIEEMINAAKEHHTLLCGGSSLKYMDEIQPLRRFCQSHSIAGGHVNAPVSMDNEYGGFYFYSQHLVEILTAVFGYDVRSVYARRSDGDDPKHISVIFHYDGFDVTAQYLSDIYTYSAAVFSKDGCHNVFVNDVVYCYEKELDVFCHMVRTGKMELGYETLSRPALLLGLIEQSFLKKEEVPTRW